jgi:hypothetical protein
MINSQPPTLNSQAISSAEFILAAGNWELRVTAS